MKFANNTIDSQYYDLSLPNNSLLRRITHPHERIHELNARFGTSYEIIAVRRNRHERFISFLNFLVKQSRLYGDTVFNTISTLSIEDILFFDPADLAENKIRNTIDLFIRCHKLEKLVDDHFKNLLLLLWVPMSVWHNNDPRIIWFDFNNLRELESWVSNKLNVEFVLESSNESGDLLNSVAFDESFINRYNKIYDPFDIIKTNKTFI